MISASEHPKRRTIWIALGATVLVVSGLHHANALDQALPSEAQQAFDRGLAAVQQQAWGLAARYFTDAQNASPYHPAILFNLGLAHGKAGHELAAIAWLHAYLIAASNPSNADAVRAEMSRLEQATKDKMHAIFEQAIQAAEAIQDSDAKYTALTHYSYIPGAQARAGLLEGAVATCKRHPRCAENLDYYRLGYVARYAQSLAEAGDSEAAQALLHQLPADAQQQTDDIRAVLSTYLLRHGDATTALTIAEPIRSSQRSETLSAIVEEALAQKDVPLVFSPINRRHYGGGRT